MANPYAFNLFDQNGEPRRAIPGDYVPPPVGAQRNPYAPPGSPWATWQQPTDETTRMYYTEKPREAYQQFQNAWGSPNGNLQKFIDGDFGRIWANYIKQTELAKSGGMPALQFVDTLNKGLGDQMQQQWQGQTAYQRGENYGTMGAGRRT